ncbi:MAG: AMP-binding protein [Acidimicrobiales bacterium]|nr:AMP-binding protein [Acidimicrobiales bacterium]
MFTDLVARDPDAAALDDGTRRRTRGELLDRATRLGRLLEFLGVGTGGHVAALWGNRVEVVEAVLAATLSGAWLTPVNRHLTLDEVRYVLDDSGATVVLADPEHEELARRAAGNRNVVVAGDDLDDRLAATTTTPYPLSGPAGGTMFYTSGTTGRPKGVRRWVASDLGAQLRALAASGRPLGLTGAGPHLVTGPLHHAAPLGFALFDLHNGAPLVLMPRWDERTFLELVDRHHVTTTHLVPTMFVRLLRLPDEERARFDGSSLRTVLHGAAPVAPGVKHRMIDWWGPILVEYWGGSEGGYVTVATTQEWLDHPGTVGRPVSTYEVYAGDTAGAPLPTGDEGLLWCRNVLSDRVFEYHNAPEKTAAAFASPGVYTLGDIGRVDDDGFVHLSDRAADMIITGGMNVYPTEVAQVLADHPAVADVAVFGVPDEEWGEQVKAAVELLGDRRPSEELAEEILAFARERLAGYKVPRSVDFEEALPRFTTGKLHTRVLRDRYWPEGGRRI